MIFWIVVIFTICMVIWSIYDKWSGLPSLLITIGAIVTIILLIVIGLNYIGIEADVESYNTRYEMLKYQYENDFYDNDNEVGKYQLISDIRYWNEDLAYRKKIQRNFWVGIFYPNIYDQFEFIELEK